MIYLLLPKNITLHRNIILIVKIIHLDHSNLSFFQPGIGFDKEKSQVGFLSRHMVVNSMHVIISA